MGLNETYIIIEKNVNLYYCSICLIFGLIGSLFNIKLFSKNQYRNISSCKYFLSSSIVMLFALLVGYVPHIYGVKNSDLTNRFVFFCKIRGYVGQSLAMMYRWLMTMAWIDRCIVSSKNIYLRKFATPRRAFSLIIKIIILSILFPIDNLIFLYTKRGWCINSNAAVALYHSLFTFTSGGFLPILIMLISAIIIRRNFSSKYARQPLNKNLKTLSKCRRYQQILLILLIQVIVYILSTIPWMSLLFYGSFAYKIKNKSVNRLLTEKFLKYFFELITYLYPTFLFIFIL